MTVKKGKSSTPQMDLSHILVERRVDAEHLLKKLRAGDDFEILALRHSLCASGEQGGNLGLVPLKRLHANFAEAAQELDANQISEVVQTSFGYHIIRRNQ